jgi:hypothetical protein
MENYLTVSVLVTIIRLKFPNLKGQSARKLDVKLDGTNITKKSHVFRTCHWIGMWSASRSDQFTPKKRVPVSIDRG